MIILQQIYGLEWHIQACHVYTFPSFNIYDISTCLHLISIIFQLKIWNLKIWYTAIFITCVIIKIFLFV